MVAVSRIHTPDVSLHRATPMDEPQPQHPTRREFAKTVAAAIPLAAALGACGPSAAPSTVPGTVATPSPTTTPPPPADARDGEIDPVANALWDAVKARYASRMTAAELESVRAAIEGNLRAARSLREFALPITAEPGFVFSAYRGAR
jgi:hypothetical protein